MSFSDTDTQTIDIPIRYRYSWLSISIIDMDSAIVAGRGAWRLFKTLILVEIGQKFGKRIFVGAIAELALELQPPG